MPPRTRAPAAPLPPLTLSPTLLISDAAVISGSHPISIGEHTVIHPKCRLDSSLGPIAIGAYCVLSERALVAPASAAGIVIADYVVVETAAVVEGVEIGEGTEVGVGARIRGGAKVGRVGNRSLMGAGCALMMMDGRIVGWAR